MEMLSCHKRTHLHKCKDTSGGAWRSVGPHKNFPDHVRTSMDRFNEHEDEVMKMKCNLYRDPDAFVPLYLKTDETGVWGRDCL